jgi:Ca2+-binding RTX toxin-like protein
MATFNLTASPDIFIGTAGAADLFQVNLPGHLVGTDIVNGGESDAVTDTLRITTAMTLAASAFALVSNIERIEIAAAAGANITLNDTMVATRDSTAFFVVGGVGGDTVYGGGVQATPLVITGAAGNDVLEGGGGNDSLGGGSGNDQLRAGTGADTVTGGDGADTISTDLAALGAEDRLNGGVGTDTLLLTGAGSLGATRFATALAGFERIAAAATLAGAVAITLPGSLDTGGVTMTVSGALGADTVQATGVQAALLLEGGAGGDRLTGGALADTLQGGLDADSLYGNNGNDLLDGADGNDRLAGQAGDDSLSGGVGADTLLGGAGNDTLTAGLGTDRMNGGAGDDLYLIGACELDLTDTVADDSGAADTVQFVGPGGYAVVSSLANRFSGIERFVFSGGNDVFVATDAIGDGAGVPAVTVEGGAGNDSLNATGVGPLLLAPPLAWRLIGGDGNDTLLGGVGADTLDPGNGLARVEGGAGNDLMLFGLDALALAPTLLGGAEFADMLRLTEAGAVGAAGFANAVGIEVLELAAEGNAVVLSDALVSATSNINIELTVRGGAGDDTVDTTLLAAGRNVTIEFGDGDDVLLGSAGEETVRPGSGEDIIALGTGIDAVLFGANELSAFDVVTADTLSGDLMRIDLETGRTLGASAFAGVTGFDIFQFVNTGTAAVRLPSNLVSQSGQASIVVDGIDSGDLVVDGRAMTSIFATVDYRGGNGNDRLLGGGGADSMSGSSGEDTLVGSDGGDMINLGAGGTDRDLALITGIFDGTPDINTTQLISTADRVTGLDYEGNYIAVDRAKLLLPNGSTSFIGPGGEIAFGNAAVVLNTAEEIEGNNFGSLAAVQAVVGSRISGGTVGVDDRTILVIGGANENEFGVYLFEDRDDNTTIDVADGLYLLAIGDADVSVVGTNRGFTTTVLDIA